MAARNVSLWSRRSYGKIRNSEQSDFLTDWISGGLFALLMHAVMSCYCSMSCLRLHCLAIRANKNTCHHSQWTKTCKTSPPSVNYSEKKILTLGCLSYPSLSLSHSAGTGRRKPWERGCGWVRPEFWQCSWKDIEQLTFKRKLWTTWLPYGKRNVSESFDTTPASRKVPFMRSLNVTPQIDTNKIFTILTVFCKTVKIVWICAWFISWKKKKKTIEKPWVASSSCAEKRSERAAKPREWALLPLALLSVALPS